MLCNVYIWDPRYNTYHYMILGCLPSDALREHTQHLRRCNKFHLYQPRNPTR